MVVEFVRNQTVVEPFPPLDKTIPVRAYRSPHKSIGESTSKLAESRKLPGTLWILKKRQKKQIYFESLSPHFSMDCAPLRGFIQGDIKFIDLPIKEVYNLDTDPLEETNLAPTSDIPRLVKDLETLMNRQKGKGAKQKPKGKDADILSKMQSLGYVSGKPTKKKTYGTADDLKSLAPIIAHLHQAVEDYQANKTDQALALNPKLPSAIKGRESALKYQKY